jgi:hypothetical protein
MDKEGVPTYRDALALSGMDRSTGSLQLHRLLLRGLLAGRGFRTHCSASASHPSRVHNPQILGSPLMRPLERGRLLRVYQGDSENSSCRGPLPR